MRSILALFAVAVVAAADPIALDYADAHAGAPVALRGYIAKPAGEAKGAVLVLPEWWGCNDYARRRAGELADAGYVALAADMYGVDQVTTDPKQAGAWAGAFYQDPALMVARARAGLAALKAQAGPAGERTAAIGFCFGGSVALQLARAGEPLRAVVAFHPGLKTAAPATGAIAPRILVATGGADPMVPPADVAAFMTEMNQVKADYRVIVYGTALHAFTNPDAGTKVGVGLPVRYDAAAEADSMTAMQRLLSETLR
jgi:dienelactone hydrolase